MSIMDEAKLRTTWQNRQEVPRTVPLEVCVASFMKHTVEPRHRQLGKLAGLWHEVIPANLAERTCLESFQQGVLTVAVDSASHRFQLETLLRGGLLRELQQRFAGTLRRVRVQPGTFSKVDSSGQPRYDF